MKRWSLWLLAGLLLPTLSLAAEPHVQASMVVTGSITVNPDGSVRAFDVNQMDKLPPPVQQVIQNTVPHWQFVPIMQNGKAVAAEAGMALRIIANMLDNDHATLQVTGASFGCDARPKSNLPDECPAGTAVTYMHRRPPRYPMDAARAGVAGEVFLVLQIGRDGHVTQAAARQVNLYVRTDEPINYRKMLAAASLRAARRWIFHVPTTGPNAAKDHWVVTLPVNYILRGGFAAGEPIKEGHWNSYLPGPVQTIPWDQHDASNSANGADAVTGGAPFMRDRRFVLKTSLAGGAGQT